MIIHDVQSEFQRIKIYIYIYAQILLVILVIVVIDNKLLRHGLNIVHPRSEERLIFHHGLWIAR